MSEQGPTIAQKFVGKLSALFVPALLNGLIDFRIAHYDRSVDPARPEYDEHVIFVFWHEYISLVLGHWGHVPLSVLVSQHRDGEWVSQIAESMGLNVVRGSSTRGGSGAIRQLKKNAKFSSIAISPDGPTGPRREMAMGPIYMAALLKMPIVPVGLGMERPKRLNTWDQFALPRPFSRCRAIFGPKIYIDRRTSKDEMEHIRGNVQNLINGLCFKAEDWATKSHSITGEQPFKRARRRNQLIFDVSKTDIEPTPLKIAKTSAA